MLATSDEAFHKAVNTAWSNRDDSYAFGLWVLKYSFEFVQSVFLIITAFSTKEGFLLIGTFVAVNKALSDLSGSLVETAQDLKLISNGCAHVERIRRLLNRASVNKAALQHKDSARKSA